jgi:hypothetical protein
LLDNSAKPPDRLRHRSCLIMMVPLRTPGRGSCHRWVGTGSTIAADPAHVIQALL